MKQKLNKIRTLYEKGIERENMCKDVYNNATHEMGGLKQVALDNLHLATERVKTLKEVLDILEND
jgi:hypothetical protein